jgi:hypothetical protein
MAQSFLLLTALPNWRGADVDLGSEVRIRKLNDAERAAVSACEAEGFWICHAFENPYSPELARHKKRTDTAFKLMLYASYAVQALAPCGSTGIFQLFHSEGDNWIADALERRLQMLPTGWAVRCALPSDAMQEAPAVFERVLEAFYKPILPLQIPLWMMEQGLAAPDQHIRILLCATGLSSLTKASGQAAFRERLCTLLGGDCLIFPPDCEGRQPRYRVDEIAGHLYQLRNELAHGLPFGAIFHKKTGFLSCCGDPLLPEMARYRYDKVLEECAVFLMCRALRAVLQSRLVFDVGRDEWVSTSL